MTGYLEVLTDPSYAGQAVVMTYPLIGNYGVCHHDMESVQAWPDGLIVRELSRQESNFRSTQGLCVKIQNKKEDTQNISIFDIFLFISTFYFFVYCLNDENFTVLFSANNLIAFPLAP